MHHLSHTEENFEAPQKKKNSRFLIQKDPNFNPENQTKRKSSILDLVRLDLLGRKANQVLNDLEIDVANREYYQGTFSLFNHNA